MTAPLTRERVLEIVVRARARGERPDLSRLDLSGLDLSLMNFAGTDLAGANLRWTNLRWANLAGANLAWSDLTGANLAGANLTGANLDGVTLPGLLRVQGLPSGEVTLVPTPHGWQLSINCGLYRTVAELRELIAGDDWPEADTEEERARRRPGLELLADQCDANIAANPTLVPQLAKHWQVTA